MKLARDSGGGADGDNNKGLRPVSGRRFEWEIPGIVQNNARLWGV
jgi:hypothetical protein